MFLETSDLIIRDLTRADAPLLQRWLNDERVLAWYEGRDKPFSKEMIEEEFYTEWTKDLMRVIIEYHNKPVGYGQIYRIDGAMYKEYDYEDKGEIVYALDQFIGEPAYWSKGIGTQYLKLMFEYLVREKKANVLLTDPRTTNERAIRAYEKAGFVKVSIKKNHELHEGRYWDVWIMEYRDKEYAND